MNTSQKANAPTQRQMELIDTLINERDVSHELLERGRNMWRQGFFTQEVASLFLSAIAQSPMKTSTIHNPGFYSLNNRLIVVSKTRSIFALTRDGYVQTQEYKNSLTLKNRISRKRALHLAACVSRCVVCGRPLTDKFTARRGIGPKCSEKYLGS